MPARALKAAPAGQFDLVRANLLEGFADLCRDLGGDAADIVCPFGAETAPDAGGLVSGSYLLAIELLAHAAKALDCPDFGMRLAARQAGTAAYGPLGTVMRNSRTLGDALDYVIGHAHVHSPAARITRRKVPGEDASIFAHQVLVGDYALQEQAIEHALLAGHLGAAAITGGKARVRRVLMRHRPLSPQGVYNRYFGCDVLFDQAEDAVVFADSDLACAIVDSDAALHEEAAEMIARNFPPHAPPLHAATRGAVLRALSFGNDSNAAIAAELGMHPRTLHRHLLAQGTSFQAIKDEVRVEIMRYYIERSELSFTAIAAKLGFSEQSVMTRFCRRYLGLPPRELRARGRSGGCEACYREFWTR